MEDTKLFGEATKAKRPADKDTGNKGHDKIEPSEDDTKENNDDTKRPKDKDQKTTLGESFKVEIDHLLDESENFSLGNELNDLFESEDENGLTDEFKNKFSTIFEASVNSAARGKIESLKEKVSEKLSEFDTRFDEEVGKYKEELEDRLDGYATKVAENFLEENQLAVERGVRLENAESFMEGLRDLLDQHYVNVDESKSDLYEEQREENEQMGQKLDDQIEENLKLRNQLKQMQKSNVVESFVSKLPDSKADKIRESAKDITFRDTESFKESLKTIYESSVSTKKNKDADVDTLTEEFNQNNTSLNESEKFEYAEEIARRMV